MLLRTPPLKKQKADSRIVESPRSTGGGSDQQHRLVIYEDPLPESNHDVSEHMLCTYQCRQMVKSDFIDALDNSEKQVRDYHSRLEALNDNFSRAEAESKKFKDKLLYAEQELAATKGREHALQEQLLKEVDESQERLKRQLHLHSEVEVKLQSEINLRQKAESLAASLKEKATILEKSVSQLSESSDRERIKFHKELAQLKKDSNYSVSRIKQDLERMEFRAKSGEEESKLLKQQLAELKNQLNESLNQKSEAEKKLSNFTSQEVTSTDTNFLVKHLQEELRSYESQLREARKLNSSHESIDVLKEKLLEEKRSKERAEAELHKIPHMEINIKKLEDELSSWKQLIDGVPEVSCSADIPVKFAALQKEVIQNMTKVGEANARLKQMEVALDAAELGKQYSETEAAMAKEKSEALKSELKRIEMMVVLVTEEKDQLRKAVNQLKLEKDGVEGGETSKGTLVEELELSLSKKESCIEELEKNLCELQEVNNRQHNEMKFLHERLNSEAKRIKSLERDSDRLRSEIALLESKLGHGDFSAANTKVLRMVNTLTVDNEAKETIEALRTDLQKTKEKLEAFEELKKHSADAGESLESYISGNLAQYKEQIATLAKREERYKTVFAEKISVFRRACCELFGYKIAMDEHQRPNGIPVTRFTVQSIYAQGDDEKLDFDYESGNTNIVQNDYTSQQVISRQKNKQIYISANGGEMAPVDRSVHTDLLRIWSSPPLGYMTSNDDPNFLHDQAARQIEKNRTNISAIEMYIRKMNSIPAFTANITLESFNARTFS